MEHEESVDYAVLVEDDRDFQDGGHAINVVADGDSTPAPGWDRKGGALPALGDAAAIEVYEGASLRGVMFNAFNSIIGAGILSLPFALMLDGGVFGAILVVVVAALSERTVWMLLWCADHTKGRLYAQIGLAAVGPIMARVVDVVIMLQNYGLITGYVVVVGDVLPVVLDDWTHWSDRTLVLIVFAAVVFFPLSALRNFDNLRFTSFIALAVAIVFTFIVLVVSALALNGHPAAPPPANRDIELGPSSFVGVLRSIPLIFFAFVAHNNLLLLYGELRRQSDPEVPSKWHRKRDKMMFVARTTLIGCALIYVIVAIFGYLLFGKTTLSDLLKNFTYAEYPWFAGIKLAFALVVIFSFPVAAYGMRRSLHSLVFGHTHHATLWHRIGEAFVITALATAVGIAVPKISVVFGFTGSLTAVNVMYCFPSLFFFILARGKPELFTMRVLAAVIFCIGVFVSIGSTAGVAIGIAES